MLYRDGGLTFAEGKPTIPVPVGRCVGGTTVINSGTCFRTPDAVLARWRDEFPILSRTVYMISNSLGAMPRQTARQLTSCVSSSSWRPGTPPV